MKKIIVSLFLVSFCTIQTTLDNSPYNACTEEFPKNQEKTKTNLLSLFPSIKKTALVTAAGLGIWAAHTGRLSNVQLPTFPTVSLPWLPTLPSFSIPSSAQKGLAISAPWLLQITPKLLP